jgi:hypothetical protein
MIGRAKQKKHDFDGIQGHVNVYLGGTGACFAKYAKPADTKAIAMKMAFGMTDRGSKPMGVRKACEIHFGVKFEKPPSESAMRMAA